jgi:hypothetical protein
VKGPRGDRTLSWARSVAFGQCSRRGRGAGRWPLDVTGRDGYTVPQ